MHILSTKQFMDRNVLGRLFTESAELERLDIARALPQVLAGRILATVFYEPSTRTRFSFEAGMMKLGGQVITMENAGQASSAVKGETLEDAIRIIGGYADAIVLRHPETGTAARAAAASAVPVINGGDGTGEHPTQALFDVYTMQKELGTIEGRTITFVGDHRSGRAAHSISQLLGLYPGVKAIFVSPDALRLPEDYRAALVAQGITYEERNDLLPVLEQTDVLYIARIMKERFSSPEEYERLKDSYTINNETLRKMKKESIVMATLPRVGEINPEIDEDPRAAYFREAKNGLYVRMALLKQVLTS